MEKTRKHSPFLFVNIALVFIFTSLLSGCRQAELPFMVTITPTITETSAVTPTLTASMPTVSITPTITEMPTFIPLATKTPTATMTEIGAGLSADAVWLAYLSSEQALTVLNENGTGKTLLVEPIHNFMQEFDPNFCNLTDDPSVGLDPSSRAAIFDGTVYFVNHSNFMRHIGLCVKRGFAGDGMSGLLAIVAPVRGDDASDLIFFEMPGGRVHDRFSQVKCLAETNCYDELNFRSVLWSPNQRYLAFSASLESASTDLYVYDRQNRSIRKLSSGVKGGAESVLGWSPDGAWIIVQDSLSSALYAHSVSAVSLDNGEVRVLYTLGVSRFQNILAWVDDKKVLVYGGDISNALEMGGNLWLADIAGDAKNLFKSDFYWAKFDQASGVVGVYAMESYKSEYQYGMYLVSTKDLSVTYVDNSWYEWNENLNMFVSMFEMPCPYAPTKIKTLSTSGKVECVEAPTPTPVPAWHAQTASPDGNWQVIVKDGQAFLEGSGISSLIMSDLVTQVFWSPDSSGFFFVSNKALYRVSVPELMIENIDKELEEDTIDYQWLNP